LLKYNEKIHSVIFTLLFLLLVMLVLISSCAFKISNETKLNEKSISNSYDEFDKLPQKYTPKLAEKNGDVVEVHGKNYNIEKLDKFIERFKNKEASVGDMIRITTYTVEGDAIIYDLIISDKHIKLIVDNTRDVFSSPEYRKKKEYKLVDIFKKNQNEAIYYIVKNDKGEESTLVSVK